MCGIYGHIKREGFINEPEFIESLNTLSKRGPDDFGAYIKENIGIGQRRLSIIDLSENGRQPLFSEEGKLSIVFNGEIYNYKDLLFSLKKIHTYKSKTDTEVILHSYEEMVYDSVKKLDGMFSLGILDEKKKEFFLARDYFGKKPLYYFLDEEEFVFASEIKAILSTPGIKSKISIDRDSLSKYIFYGYIPSPHSVFNKIKKIKPAHYLVFDYVKWHIKEETKFWDLEKIGVNNNLTESQIIEKIDSLLDTAVEKRLMSDVPLGLFLSGGLDSSLIAHYVSKYTTDLLSYTVSYPEIKKIDETSYAKYISDKYGLGFNPLEFKSDDVLDNFTEILDYIDEPFADAAVIPLYYISKFAAKDIKVVLSGDGGDEIFAGYPKYIAQIFSEKIKFTAPFVNLFKPFFDQNSQVYKIFEGLKLDFWQRQFFFGSGAPYKYEMDYILENKQDLANITEDSRQYFNEYQQTDMLNKSLFLDCKIQLPDWYMVKGDRATMANSLEMRNPMLDKNLAEFMFSIPGKIKIKNGTPKYLTKKLAERYFPKNFIYRKKKGFGVPLDNWIRNELKDLFIEYLQKENDFISNKYSMQLLTEHLLGWDHQFTLLRIFNFNYFLSKWDR